MANGTKPGVKVAPKAKLNMLTSEGSTSSNLTEIGRTPLLDLLKIGCKLGKLWFTQAKQWTDENNEVHEGVGGKPGIHFTMSDAMLERYEISAPTVILWFHSSAKALLELTGNKLHKRMSLIEVKNEETEDHSFMIIEKDANLASENTADDFVDDED